MLRAAVDAETTGLDPRTADIITLGILPYTDTFDPDPLEPGILIYSRPIKIETISPRALQVNGHTMEEILNFPERLEGIERLRRFVERVGKISPLAHNWAFDKAFIADWLQPEYELDDFFDYRARDTSRVAMFFADRAKAKGKAVPFRSQSLGGICEAFKVEHKDAHTSLGDCAATLALYKKFVNL